MKSHNPEWNGEIAHYFNENWRSEVYRFDAETTSRVDRMNQDVIDKWGADRRALLSAFSPASASYDDERCRLDRLMVVCEGNASECARRENMSKQGFSDKLKRYGLRK